MDPKLTFLFYLAAVVCFGVAALAPGAPGLGGRGGGIAGRISLVPLGLALWLFPTMWDTGTNAF